MNKLWPIVNEEDTIIAAAPAPLDAKEYLTWEEWVSIQGRIVRFSEIKGLMEKNENASS